MKKNKKFLFVTVFSALVVAGVFVALRVIGSQGTAPLTGFSQTVATSTGGTVHEKTQTIPLQSGGGRLPLRKWSHLRRKE